MKDQSSSHSTSRTPTLRIFSAMMRSHFSPAFTSIRRIVPMWTPVIRDTLDTLLPSRSMARMTSAFSMGRYMPVQWLLAQLQERLRTLTALEPLVSFPVATVALAFDLADRAVHCETLLEFHSR